MALWAYALRTVEQVKASPWYSQGNNLDGIIEDCINEASELVEKAWGRHIVSRGSLTEYHPRLEATAGSGGVYTPPWSSPSIALSGDSRSFALGPELYLNEYPIVSVTTVHEDAARAYGAGALLTVNTDYIVTKPVGKLVRLSGGLPRGWLSSWRCVKVVYSAGYQVVTGTTVAGADTVPLAILRVFDELVAWMIRQRHGKEVGLQVSTDAMGTRSFSGPAYITSQMQLTLDAAGASPSMRCRTGERDS